jgi:ComF family protein
MADTGIREILDFLYPPLCLICGEGVVSDRLICDSCWTKASNQGIVFCSECREVLVDSFACPESHEKECFPVVSLGRYIPPLKDIIHHFKYHGFSRLGLSIVDRLFADYTDSLKSLKIDGIIPIPLDSYREKMRGFNQASVLTDIIGKKLNLPMARNALRKIRRTKDQTRLDILEREANMRGTFAAETEFVSGGRFLLVDDVFTTGATIKEAARAIGDAGGKVTAALVVASV